MTAFIEARA